MRQTRGMLATVAVAALLLVCTACGGSRNEDEVAEPEPTIGSPGGAGSPAPSGRPVPSGTPTLSSVPPPTLGPQTGPPRTPSDPRPTGWIAGRVTRGGSGPCYGLETDDGIDYVLYNAEGLVLETGAVIRARIEPLPLQRIYCGSGLHVQLLEVQAVG